MPPRSKVRRGGQTKRKILVALVVVVVVGTGGFYLRDLIQEKLAHDDRPADLRTHQAVDSVYSQIAPARISTTTTEIGGRRIRHDHLVLAKKASLLRANFEITRAVENAGGEVVYGVELADEKRRRTTVTLGVSDGDSLVREIKLEKRTR